MLPKAVGAQVHGVQRSSGRFEQSRGFGSGVGQRSRRLLLVGGENSARRTANGTGESVRDALPVAGRWTGMRWIVIVVTIAAAVPAVGCLFNVPMLTGRWCVSLGFFLGALVG